MHKRALYLTIAIFCLVTSQTYTATFEELLEQHTQALTALKPHIPKIMIETTATHGHQQIIYHYDYHCPTQEIKEKLNSYLASYANVQNHIMFRACGRGAIIGALLAACNYQFFDGKSDNKRTGVAFAAIASLPVYRYFRYGPIQHLNANLQLTGADYGAGPLLLEMGASSIIGFFSNAATTWVIGKLTK